MLEFLKTTWEVSILLNTDSSLIDVGYIGTTSWYIPQIAIGIIVIELRYKQESDFTAHHNLCQRN